MNKTKIDWLETDGRPGYTFNPITGCPRGCEYCYARRIHERFYKTPFSDIVLHPDRLGDPDLWNKPPSKIFVGSMTDIAYWDTEQKRLVMRICYECQQHTFMFLSKSPGAYMGFYKPKNVMCGLTVTHIDESNYEYVDWFARVGSRPFLSIEPILGKIKYSISDKFELVIVGAMTGVGATPHKQEWVDSVFEKSCCKNIHLKQNVKKEVDYGTKSVTVG